MVSLLTLKWKGGTRDSQVKCNSLPNNKPKLNATISPVCIMPAGTSCQEEMAKREAKNKKKRKKKEGETVDSPLTQVVSLAPQTCPGPRVKGRKKVEEVNALFVLFGQMLLLVRLIAYAVEGLFFLHSTN